MTSTKQAKISQSFSERASIAVAETEGVDHTIPRVLTLMGDDCEKEYLDELAKAEKIKTMTGRAKIIALDTVMRNVRTTMADEWGRNYASLGYCHIYSPKLDDEIILCRDDKIAKVLKEEKKQKVYTEREIEQFRNLSLEEMRTLHDAHEIFGGELADPKRLGKTDLRNNGAKAKARFRQAKKKNSKYSRFKKSTPS